MNNRRAEFKDYNTNKVTYDTKKAIYNGSLRIETAPGASNWYDFALPPSATSKQGTFTFPPYPFMPYVPPNYNGPTFDATIPYTGYGQATETLLKMTTGNQAIANYQVKGFGTIGFTNSLTQNAKWWTGGSCSNSYMAITMYPITAAFSGIDTQNFAIDFGEVDWDNKKDLSPLDRSAAVLPPDVQWNSAQGLISSAATLATIVAVSLY